MDGGRCGFEIGGASDRLGNGQLVFLRHKVNKGLTKPDVKDGPINVSGSRHERMDLPFKLSRYITEIWTAGLRGKLDMRPLAFRQSINQQKKSLKAIENAINKLQTPSMPSSSCLAYNGTI